MRKQLPVKCSIGAVILAIAVGQVAAPTAGAEGKSHDREFSGLADYYSEKLVGRKTASGQVLTRHRLTAAHRRLPFGTRVKVVNKRNGRSCIVEINDRGPFTPNKVIDLSHQAAKQIGMLRAGTCLVACTVIDKLD